VIFRKELYYLFFDTLPNYLLFGVLILAMRQSLFKIAYILFLFLVVPVIGYSIFEYSQLDKNEKVIADIYNKQLETILFSVNQYADDMVSSWAHKITQSVKEKDEKGLKSLLSNSRSISYIFILDSNLQKEPVIHSPDSQFIPTKEMKDSLLTKLLNKRDLIDRLFNYLKAGYQKMEPLIVQGNEVILTFVNSDGGLNIKIYGIALNSPKFVSFHLGPRIAGIVGDDFVASVIDSTSNTNIFTSSVGDSITELYSKPLWIIPKYKLIIGSKEISINQVVANRTKLNFTILLLVTAIFLIGVLMVFLNIRKEIKLAQLKSEFVSNVSHEIRTPLSVIKLYIETLLMHRTSPEKTDEYYNIINQETSRLSSLVNRILSFSKIDSGKKKLNFNDVDVNKLVSQIRETYLFHLQSKGFECSFEIEDKLPFIFGDAEAITEMLVNLIDNAVKYSADNKKITIKAYKTESSLNIEVHDSGIGIASKYHKQIFEDFFRVPSNLVHNTKGTGLGLSIVKQTMDIHKGSVSIKSEPGKGSCFCLRFPLH
jgi:two-component system phosphate regulon sensor histidine kinase PhoR